MLAQFQGEPQRVVKDPDGSELWEYYKQRDMIIPKGESMSFFGGGSNYGLGGAFSSESGRRTARLAWKTSCASRFGKESLLPSSPPESLTGGL